MMTRRELRQRGARGFMMEDIRAEIHTVGPSNRSGFRVYAHLAKHVDLFKPSEDAATTNDPVTKINLTM